MPARIPLSPGPVPATAPRTRPAPRQVRRLRAQVTKAVADVRDPQADDKPFHMPQEMELGFISLVHNGTVRETDLDDKRFEVRGIEAGNLTDLRCICGPKVTDRAASRWLNQRVEVTGRVERDSKGRARLMKVSHLKLVDAPEDSPDQIEFDFPDSQQ